MITFKSRATASVMMFDAVATTLLDIMGKSAEPTGIITVEQLPGAIEKLRAAAQADRSEPRAPQDETEAEEDTPRAAPAVSLAQRAVPLIDMLSESLRADEPVIWER